MIDLHLSHINFFNNKKINILPNIYLNDNNPCCFLVECEQKYYKLRLPSKFNPNAISCEINALKMLHPCLQHMIPHVIESNNINNMQYIVETYLPVFIVK